MLRAFEELLVVTPEIGIIHPYVPLCSNSSKNVFKLSYKVVDFHMTSP